ncbi:MAG: NAD(P)H-dependent oxidoreductase, partial [Clostridia bacterium]|nr:NAD(P)H-dependent oxidoreductase [Clostridia bacterium]
NGSINKDGNCRFLIDTVLNDCKQMGAEVEVINIPEAIMDSKNPFCVQCSSPCQGVCYKGTKLGDAYDKVAKADAVIIASPVYFASMSAQLKAFWDRSSEYRKSKAFVGKPTGFITCGHSRFGGQESTLHAMQSSALVQGMTIINSGSAEYDAGHIGISAQAPADKDEFAISRCHSMAIRIMNEIKK